MSEKRRLGEIGSARGDAFLSRGRASRSNEAGRFERLQTEAFDHGWSGSKDGEPPRVETTLTAEGEDHHLAQRKPRSRVRSISESVPGLRARLHLLRGSRRALLARTQAVPFAASSANEASACRATSISLSRERSPASVAAISFSATKRRISWLPPCLVSTQIWSSARIRDAS